MKRILSDHAIARFRQRHGSRTTPVRVIQQVLEAGRFQTKAPHNKGLERRHKPDGFVVNKGVVFVVYVAQDARGNDVLVASTCLAAQVRSKAERRAYRELAREEEEWAA